MPVKKKGIFITLEGGEGGGKTTQMRRLEKLFAAAGREVVLSREPGGTEISDRIRELILSHDIKGIAPLAELFLYEASRAQHVIEKIAPALARGAVVISDRFTDSSVVYQGIARKQPEALVKSLNRIATKGLMPHFTFIFDLDPAEGFARIAARGELDRMESEQLSFHRAIRRGYLRLARQEPRRCSVIDASQDPEQVEADILQILRKRKALR